MAFFCPARSMRNNLLRSRRRQALLVLVANQLCSGATPEAIASAMNSGNATTATPFEKEGPAQSREASPFMDLCPKQPKSLLPLDGVGSAVPSLQLHPVFGIDTERVPPNDAMSRFVGFGDKSWDNLKNFFQTQGFEFLF